MHKGFSLVSLLIVTVVLAVGFGGGYVVGQQSVNPVYLSGVTNLEEGKPDAVDFSLFWEVWSTLEKKYVGSGTLNYQDMLYGAISGMLESLDDPHTVFMTPEQAKSFLSEVEGSFEGVGMEVGIRNEQIQVIAPLEGTPAQRAGLRSGDVIVAIDGTSTATLTLEEAVQLIRGPEGTEVMLSIQREGLEEVRDFVIERGVIEIPSLTWSLLNEEGEEDPSGTVVYIKLYQFSEKARADFRQAVSEITASRAEKVVLDVRNNPGGLLHVAQDIASWFLPEGNVVVRENFDSGREDEVYEAEGNPALLSYPAVVLINEGSASASEILAGALRDNRGIQLVGTSSFGKGSVQELERLHDGSYLKVTVARWLTPDGELIEGEGLQPDVEVEMTDEDFEEARDPQLQRSLELLQDL